MAVIFFVSYGQTPCLNSKADFTGNQDIPTSFLVTNNTNYTFVAFRGTVALENLLGVIPTMIQARMLKVDLSSLASAIEFLHKSTQRGLGLTMWSFIGSREKDDRNAIADIIPHQLGFCTTFIVLPCIDAMFAGSYLHMSNLTNSSKISINRMPNIEYTFPSMCKMGSINIESTVLANIKPFFRQVTGRWHRCHDIEAPCIFPPLTPGIVTATTIYGTLGLSNLTSISSMLVTYPDFTKKMCGGAASRDNGGTGSNRVTFESKI